MVSTATQAVKGSSSVRSKSLIFLFLLGFVPCVRAADSGPVDCTHLLAWTAGAVPSRKLISVVETRGLAFTRSERALSELRAAGASQDLLEAVRKAKLQGASECPAALVEAARLIRSKDLAGASDAIDAILDKNAGNDALHFLFGYVKQRQADWDG